MALGQLSGSRKLGQDAWRTIGNGYAIPVVLFVIVITRNSAIHTVDMPLPEVALPVVMDIAFTVALIAAQAQFFRNLSRDTGQGPYLAEPPLACRRPDPTIIGCSATKLHVLGFARQLIEAGSTADLNRPRACLQSRMRAWPRLVTRLQRAYEIAVVRQTPS